jgi:hypothetical protein
MTDLEKNKLQALLLRLYNLGSSNMLIRKAFEKEAEANLASPKEWDKFIDEFLRHTLVK